MEEFVPYEELKQRYNTICQSELDAIITSDESRNIQSWNKGAKALFGYNEEEVIGKPVTIIIPERYREQHINGVNRVSNGGKPKIVGQTVEVEGLRKDGTEFPVELTLGLWSSGGKKYYSAIIRDITRRKENERIITEQHQQILEEKAKSDSLLKNILPEQVIPELKSRGKTDPQKYESVSILFADIKGFSYIAKQLPGDELVGELHSMFSKFDSIVKKSGLEKIKTIGDAYMCAGGLPDANRTHALDCVMAAIELQNIIKETKKLREEQGRKYWQIRIGIHTGPVLAGVVGDWKFTYDIWGDSVNIAARMEESSLPGKVNVSQSTYELIKDFFECSHRGKVTAKNMGQMDMYLVDKIQAELSVDGKGQQGNEEFHRRYNELKSGEPISFE
ncbi:MAG: PAS domain S-box protein [bacterium]|nr:PAS domain S-box protein [bacterium]